LFPGTVIEKLYNSHPAIHLELAYKTKAVVEQDYNHIIGLEYSDDFNGFIDMEPAEEYTSTLAPHHGGADEVVVFVVDPAWDCVASYVAHVPLLHEYKIVKVMTRIGEPTHPCSDRPVVDIYQNITYNSLKPNDALAAETICPKLRQIGLHVAAVIPTFDPAIYLADRLAACVGAKGNPFEGPLAHARFDKWALGEAVRKAGLRAPKEKLVNTWNEAKGFLESLNPPVSHAHPVIFKLLQSSNSQGVTKVYSMKQAEDVFSKSVGSTTQYGDRVTNVLIQECFTGKEYVVDSVSRDGVHKTVIVWHEDLRPGNGYFDLYYGFKAMDPEDEKIRKMIDYANKVLDATGVRNGASDMEMFWIEEEDQPCVTDLNARWTALMWKSGLDLENVVTGNNQITATINAFLDGDAFHKMPFVPSMNEYGAIIFVLPHHTGRVKDIPGMAVAKKLPSYFNSFNEGLFPGTVIEKLYNSHPAIHLELAYKTKAVVEQDYNHIIGLEYSDDFNGFIDMEPAEEYTSLLAPHHGGAGLSGNWLPALAALVTVFAAAWTFVKFLARSGRDATDYLTME